MGVYKILSHFWGIHGFGLNFYSKRPILVMVLLTCKVKPLHEVGYWHHYIKTILQDDDSVCLVMLIDVIHKSPMPYSGSNDDFTEFIYLHLLHMWASRCLPMAGSIQFLDITVDDGQPEAGLSRLLEAVKPHWDLGEVCRSPLLGGCFNTIYCCHKTRDKGRNDAFIVRIYCGNMAEVVDRNKEFLSIQVAQAAGCHAPIYASFNNGVVYKYTPGFQPTLHDLANPMVIRQVAQKLFRLHQIDVSSVDLLDRKGNRALYDKTVDEYDWMDFIAAAIPSKPNNPDLEADFQRYRADFPDDLLHPELKFVRSIMRNARLPVSFIHGDIHKRNIVIDSAGQVTFIDFEASAVGYRYFDLGYFFLYWHASPWLEWCQPGEPALIPEIRRQYLEAYLEAKCEYEGRDRKCVSAEEWELMDLQHQVVEFVLFYDMINKPLALINEPTIPAKFMYFHPKAKDTYFKFKDTITNVIDRIEELDNVINGSWQTRN